MSVVAGRLDMLIQAICDKGLELIEQKHGMSGLKENLSPIMGKYAKELVGDKQFEIPDEAIALYKIFRMNQGKLGQGE